MCSNMGAGARRAAAPAAPAAQTAAPAAAPAAAQQATSRLVSDTGVQDMDDAALTALITRAMNATITPDGRQDTPAQRIADALGITQNVPESVPQEALAQYRGKVYEQGTIYRTVNNAGGKTGRQIAHDLTSSSDYGLNFGGGRCWGCGLYFAGSGPNAPNSNYGAVDSSNYGSSARGAYTMEARFKSTAKVATVSDVTGPAGRAWAKKHAGALRKMGLSVTASGSVTSRSTRSMSSDDMHTTLALLMGYDAYRGGTTTVPYYTIFNRGALQVARGNKYDRASNWDL